MGLCECGFGRPTMLAVSLRNDVEANIVNMTMKHQSRRRSGSGIRTVEEVSWSASSGNASAVVDMRRIVRWSDMAEPRFG